MKSRHRNITHVTKPVFFNLGDPNDLPAVKRKEVTTNHHNVYFKSAANGLGEFISSGMGPVWWWLLSKAEANGDDDNEALHKPKIIKLWPTE